jgi:hypothetical protein
MAEIEEVDADPERAREFLSQAKTFLKDAAKEDLSLESTVVLYWNACISGMDAVLSMLVVASHPAHIVTLCVFQNAQPFSALDTPTFSTEWTSGVANAEMCPTRPFSRQPPLSLRWRMMPVT